ncbi:DMT family transporter [Xenorhabdus bharatensis]|uniref:DMT family transporter n=1 Tax=Xenorhabdus bharatensis TaxID=3136256 RepID=UPI0030F3FAA4
MLIRNTPQLAIVLTLIAAFFWGSNFQVTKIALMNLPPWTASAERFAFSVLFIFLLMLSKKKFNIRVFKKNWLAFIFLGGIGVAGFNGALFVGLQYANPVSAALIMATTPVTANILEAIIHRRSPDRLRIIGMMLSLFGVALVVTNGQPMLDSTIHINTGELIIFLGSLGWAIYTIGARTFIKESTPLETTGWTMFFGTIILSIIAVSVESPVSTLLSAPFESHLADFYMGIAGSVVAYLFWNMAIAIRGAGKTAIFFNFVPVFALVIQAIVGDCPSLTQLTGSTLTIIGVLIGQGISKISGRNSQ